MVLTVKRVKGEAQSGPDWERELAPFRALLTGPAAPADTPGSAPPPAVADLDTLLALARNAGGILVHETGSGYPHWERLTGLPGERAALAAALTGCFGDTPEAAGPARAAASLAGLVACGEVYHLLRCVEALTRRPLGEPFWADTGADAGPVARDPRHAGRPSAGGADLPLHLETALTLLTERLALTAAAGPLASELAERLRQTTGCAWRALARALDAPVPAGLWPTAAARRADAGRLCCAWLAALACLDAAPGARPDGLPGLEGALADLDAALGPGAGAGPGLRALFHAEVRDMADTLAVLAPEAAAPVLGQRLAQDWARLPAPVAERLRAACLTPGTRVSAALAGASDAQAVLAVAERYAARPALVVAAFGALALRDGRCGPGGAGRDPECEGGGGPADLAALGHFIAGLYRRIAPAPAAVPAPDRPADAGTPPEQLPPLLPALPPTAGAGGLTARLVADPDFGARLGALLAAGERRRRTVWALVMAMGRIDLEGLALGEYLPAVQVLEQTRLAGEPAAPGGPDHESARGRV